MILIIIIMILLNIDGYQVNATASSFISFQLLLSYYNNTTKSLIHYINYININCVVLVSRRSPTGVVDRLQFILSNSARTERITLREWQKDSRYSKDFKLNYKRSHLKYIKSKFLLEHSPLCFN
jgi:hypothetical protein